MENTKRIENLSKFVDEVSVIMKEQKKIFTENFYKDYTFESRAKLSFAEKKQLNSDYETQWEAKEEELYKSFTAFKRG